MGRGDKKKKPRLKIPMRLYDMAGDCYSSRGQARAVQECRGGMRDLVWCFGPRVWIDETVGRGSRWSGQAVQDVWLAQCFVPGVLWRMGFVDRQEDLDAKDKKRSGALWGNVEVDCGSAEECSC